MGKAAFITGAGGFIAGHLATRLKSEGYIVHGCDIKPLEEWWFGQTTYDIAVQNFDARNITTLDHYDEVYNLACDMGGMGFIANNTIETMNSVDINMHVLKVAVATGVKKYFYSSSACVYPNISGKLHESMAYPAMPDSPYGWEKLFNEIYCQEMHKRLVANSSREDGGPPVEIYIARFHNVYGPRGTWKGGREKAPAAICRKVAEVKHGLSNSVEIWGSGEQGRSFLYIDDCVQGIRDLVQSERWAQPTNIGSEKLVTVNKLLELVCSVVGGEAGLIPYHYVDVPREQIGVATRCSKNNWFRETTTLQRGLRKTYKWIEQQVLTEAGQDYT